MRNAGGELTQRRHLLRLDQVGLGDLQLTQCRFRFVASDTQSLLGALPFGDVGVDDDEAAVPDRVMTHVDDAAVGARALESIRLADRHGQPSDLFVGVGIRAVFASGRQTANVIGERQPHAHRLVGQVENFLKIAVPGGKSVVAIEHGDTVAHVLEGDIEFVLTLADFVQQPRVVHRDHRLGSEAFQQ